MANTKAKATPAKKVKVSAMTPKQKALHTLKNKDPRDIVRVQDLLPLLGIEGQVRVHSNTSKNPEEEEVDVEEVDFELDTE